jgi:hypothetical protein
MRKLILILASAILFASCTTEVTLTVKPDDSVDIRFEGGAGNAFTKMIAGGSTDAIIDTDTVTYELARAGFSNVKAEQKGGGAVLISMSDLKQSSYVFSSGIAKVEKGRLSAAITRKSLEDFYKSADEQTRMTLDLFLAPVFNDEIMSEEEYLEMLGSFYGEAAAKEVSESVVKISLISLDGTKETLRFPLVQLLCGNF